MQCNKHNANAACLFTQQSNNLRHDKGFDANPARMHHVVGIAGERGSNGLGEGGGREGTCVGAGVGAGVSADLGAGVGAG